MKSPLWMFWSKPAKNAQKRKDVVDAIEKIADDAYALGIADERARVLAIIDFLVDPFNDAVKAGRSVAELREHCLLHAHDVYNKIRKP